jgi:ribosome maturation factor RimP
MFYPVGSRPLLFWAKSSMDSRSVAERVREIAEQAALDHGVELVHAEVAGPDGKPIVRVFIDKPGGVTHEDCSEVSLHVGTKLDVDDFIHSAYTLEVSSPGIERGLYKRADFERFAGSAAKIKARTPVNGQRNFSGRIVGVAEKDVILDDRTNGRVKIPIGEIAKANLEIDIEQEFKLAREREARDRELIKLNR